MEVPGPLGLRLVSDKSLEFFRDPVSFVQKRVSENSSKIFQVRVLNRPTVFICCNDAVKVLLNEKTNYLRMGYKRYMHQLFDDNLFFTEGPEAEHHRAAYSILFQEEYVTQLHSDSADLIRQGLAALRTDQLVNGYEFFKKLSTSLFLKLVLDPPPEIESKISELAIQHWHGLLSVPFSIKLPFSGKKSSYAKATEAKQSLLELIRQCIATDNNNASQCPFAKRMLGCPFASKPRDIENNLLLFTCALAPKACASMIASFIVQLGEGAQETVRNQVKSDPEYLDFVLLEVIRLFPPFVCGRRTSLEEFELCGYRIPADYAVMYFTYTAHRDPDVFPDPDKFLPERWAVGARNENDRDRLFTFGGGSRKCVSNELVWRILKEMATQLLDQFEWSLATDDDPAYKWFPVARPSSDFLVAFRKRSS